MKCILSLRVARHLLAKGFRIIDIEQSRKIPGTLAFVFERSAELEQELSTLRK
ncbi:hypothetical protein V7183_04820 [Bacillus sp. JJ1127]|uniref:hypothetical protein n=1 Tax=Bacillus sp. JJ1127 TaxID=3122952 RepID=UPI002FFDC632